MAILNAPGGIYSALSGNRISVNAEPEEHFSVGEEYHTFRVQLYASRMSLSYRFQLHGQDSWVDWGDGTVTTPSDIDWGGSTTAIFSHTYTRSGIAAAAETIPDTRIKYSGNFDPIPLDPEATVDVLTLTVHTMAVSRSSWSLGLSFSETRTLHDPIPVRRGNVTRAWLNNQGLNNPQFRAPRGLYKYLEDFWDLGDVDDSSGSNNLNFFTGTSIAVLPSVFSEDSRIVHIDNSRDPGREGFFTNVVFSEQGSGNRTRVFEGFENHTLGRRIGSLNNFSYISFGISNAFRAPSGFDKLAPDLSGVRVLNNYRHFRNLRINLANSGNRNFLSDLFSAIDSSGRDEDHPFYFDASSLEIYIDNNSSYSSDTSNRVRFYAGTTAGRTPEYVFGIMANIRPFMPSLANARNLRILMHDGDEFGNRILTSSEFRDFRPLNEVQAGFLTANKLPVGGSLRVLGGGIIKRLQTLVRPRSGAIIAYSAAEWAAAGVPPWVLEGRSGANDYLIYRSIPDGTETVLDFNGSSEAHIFCSTDRTQIDYGLGDEVITRLTGVVEQPKLPSGVRFVLGYYRNFMLGSEGLMEGVPLSLDPAYPGDSTQVNEIYNNSNHTSGGGIDMLPDDNIVVPALPDSVEYVQDFMPGAFILGRRSEVNNSRNRRSLPVLPISPERIKIELGDMPNLIEINGWLEYAYAGYWQISRISGRENDFVPVPRNNGVRMQGLFTEAFARVGHYCGIVTSGATSNTPVENLSSENIGGVPPGEAGTYPLRIASSNLEGLRFAASRRIWPLSMFNGMSPAGEGNFQGAFNGNWYGDLGSFCNQHGIGVEEVLSNANNGYFENGGSGNYSGPGIAVSNDEQPTIFIDTEHSLDF